MSTNDDVFAVIKGASQTTRRRYNNSSNNSSSDAALRRLYIVPMKGGVYDKLHGPLEE